MLFPPSSSHHQQYLHYASAVREVSEDANSPIHNLRGSDESLRQAEPRRTVEDYAEIRLPERFTHMMRQLHESMRAQVTDNGAVSEAFAVTNGEKKSCELVPTLFNLVFLTMLMDAYCDERPGMDSRLLKKRRMHFPSRLATATIHELLFAEDCALKGNMDCASTRKKTVVMPPSTTTYDAAPINANGIQMKALDTFTYLGRNLSRGNKIDYEVGQRIVKASQAFGRMKNIFTL
ncbi:unnamed protein product [Schistocephalus solidus]|uniref:Reverse transcriptase domain-containing protein n=1 Tax=Schistocephalus solidus TaxID=70667 RepID=A0A183SGT2_SCHSO|nr:unnamed protein product [Schistocephalus solidus]